MKPVTILKYRYHYRSRTQLQSMWTFQRPGHGKERRGERIGRGMQKNGKWEWEVLRMDRECPQGRKQPLALLEHCSCWWKVIYTHLSFNLHNTLWNEGTEVLNFQILWGPEPDWHPDGLHTWGHSMTHCRHCPVKDKGKSSSALFSLAWGVLAVYMVPSIQAPVVMTYGVYAENFLDLHFPQISHLVAELLLLYRVTLCQFEKGTLSGWTI